MRKVDTNARYDEDLNNWVRQEEEVFLVGLTDFGQKFIGEVSLISELPTIGSVLKQGALYGVLESDKASNEIYLPIGGTVIAINEALQTTPNLINKDCYDSGWIIKLDNVVSTEWAALKSATFYEAAISSFFNK